jgi:hypothetical protein
MKDNVVFVYQKKASLLLTLRVIEKYMCTLQSFLLN